MSHILDKLAIGVRKKLGTLKFPEPNLGVVRHLLEVAYWASLKTEEGRFTRSSITYANPQKPDPDPPILRRADYPDFTKFGNQIDFTVEQVAKLSRAIDKWSASIAVYGKTPKQLKVWGIVDQLVQQSVRHNREGQSGFSNPGILTIGVDGVGDLSVHHGNIFLGGVRKNQLVTKEENALESDLLWERIEPYFESAAVAISRRLPDDSDLDDVLFNMLYAWSNTVARICIGVRRLGTGGGFLITPLPKEELLSIGRPFNYKRLRDAMVLNVLDQMHLQVTEEIHHRQTETGSVSADVAWDLSFAEADAEDRETELAGASKLTCSLATLDGVVLLTPMLEVLGFGVKIGSAPSPTTIYDALDFARRGSSARKIDVSKFGTRHGSILRYCRADSRAIGVIISQDGQVRIVAKLRGSLVLWDEVKLLDDVNFSPAAARDEVQFRARKTRDRSKRSRGYTKMPKTMAELMKARTLRSHGPA